MDIFRIIAFINLCVFILFFIIGIISQIVRGINPVVLGIFFYAFSITLLNPNILSLLMLIIVLISYNYKVVMEARELEKRLGSEWYDYCQKTGNYFPKLFIKSR